MSRPTPSPRSRFPAFRTVTLRWNDNDIYGHVNNAVHYGLFDTAVNDWLLDSGLLDPVMQANAYLVVSTSCDYFAQIAYPDLTEIGLAIEQLGTSSVAYHLGLFRKDAPLPVAEGRFVHVKVDPETRRPLPISDADRRRFQALIPADL